MQATEQHRQILRFFIEEAKEHLDTIEKGLLNLQATLDDVEETNCLFRAAHSVKGGAAMLGLDSILKTGHYLEDYFKLLKDNPIKIDRKVEDLFLRGFDEMKGLVEALQSPFGLRAEDGEQSLARSVPIFQELGNHLNTLISVKKAASAGINSAAAAQVGSILRMMLQLFKQGDNPKARQQLTVLCSKLAMLDKKSHPWLIVLKTTQRTIANPKASFAMLAPVVIKELKLASDLLIAGRSTEIIPSTNLKKLLPNTTAPAQAAAKVAEKASSLQAAAKASVQAAPRAKRTEARASNSAVGLATRRQITIPGDPKGAARSLLDQFSKAELIQIAEFLMKAIQ
ncbi:MAG: Hpt domain-containing protein [Alkalinema sp. FL-bin-369]|nr:Hpt domain-containing protein [Leptolyngbyaceae cyanobacterium LF-bin-369]